MGYAAGVATALKVFQRHRIYLWKYFETAVMFVCFLSITDFKHLLLVFCCCAVLIFSSNSEFETKKEKFGRKGWKLERGGACCKNEKFFFVLFCKVLLKN